MKQTLPLIFLMSVSLGILSCDKEKHPNTNSTTKTMKETPLLAAWDTPFGVPPFDLIKSEDYLPAFEKAIANHKEELQKIINSKEAPTFQNTIEALEFAGSDLRKVSNVFYAVKSANTDSIIDATSKKLAPILSAHYDEILFNSVLAQKVKTVFDNSETVTLSPEQHRLLEKRQQSFDRAGANLDAKSKSRLKEINETLASLSQQFSDHLLKETNVFEYHTTSKEDLGNLPQNLVALAADASKKKGHESGWSFGLQRPSINPFLQSSPNTKARKTLYDGYANRANNDNANDNKAVLSKMAALRVEKAILLGHEDHASYVLEDAMAANPEAVLDFMNKLWPSALKMAKEERDALATTMKKDGYSEAFQGSDWRHYVEKIRKERYAFDEEETRPYFEVNAVREGAFQLATKLFGLTFKELQDLPKWHEDQQVFEVLEADGTHLGILYMDFFARESKRGGAWMNALIQQSNVQGKVTPIVTNNFNYPAPSGENPSLLSFGEAETLFHEFGHALHGLLSNVQYRSLSGTSVPRDFVEFPSQVMENWMSEPEVLKLFAKHYKTGEVIPDAIIKKMKDANAFNGGFATVEYMAAAYLDMAWHTLKDSEIRDANAFEKEAMANIGLIEEIIPRYRSTYFQHIFSGGYAAGYYSYLWSEVLDADTFKAFKDTGNLFDPSMAKKYRKMLSMGGSKPGMELYKEFRGQEPEIGALLEKKGFQ